MMTTKNNLQPLPRDLLHAVTISEGSSTAVAGRTSSKRPKIKPIAKRAQEAGETPAPSEKSQRITIWIVVSMAAVMCALGPFLIPYLDPSLKLPLWKKVTAGLIAFPIFVGAFMYGIKLAKRK